MQFGKRHQEKWGNRFVLLNPEEEVIEYEYQNALVKSDQTIFINFHGTSGKTKRNLDILLPKSIPCDEFSEYEKMFKANQLGYWHLPPNRILIEYLYQGDDIPFDAEKFKRLEEIYRKSGLIRFGGNVLN